ncbi:MAG TPA: glutamine--fructose-6-phosphate transaminase (isomerizing) [Planctomycetota bacterium]|jgi:glucosamine--fructose-6-phosphate aminotransferase (isomerizing)|nr:glutamine--fructose-6-phosphate transaminase (isomerizing) [Planctomycetota bacterium]
MCGIVGYVGTRDTVGVLLDSLKRLEYRGYDSAGVVVINGKGLLHEKATGNIAALESALKAGEMKGRTGLGHTRWATHGGVTRENAHPHFSCDARVAVVHNGIVENYTELKEELSKTHSFRSGTDTEVIPHLIEEAYPACGKDPLRAIRAAMERMQGSFALAVVFADHPDEIYVARVNCPIVLGVGEGESFLASDIAALLPYTRRVIPLEEGELARLSPSGVTVLDFQFKPKTRQPLEIPWSLEMTSKGNFAHYMLKEIHEQKHTLASELIGRAEDLQGLVLPDGIRRIVITACGTAWHAGLVGKLALEELARVPVDVWLASELRYADYPFGKDTLAIAISQSGETADTLASVRLAREAGATVLAVTNVRGSTLDRESDLVLHMRCGPERGVAATKTYTSQILNMILLAMHLGRTRGTLTPERDTQLRKEIDLLPRRAGEILDQSSTLEQCARDIAQDCSFIYIGRRYNLPTAYEGALKMKEISYLHAEGYGAGEMKHGPLALVDNRMICVAVAPEGRVTDKVISNIQEIRARNGRIITIGTRGDARLPSVSNQILEIPRCDEMLSPVLAVIPLQLLAYYSAVRLGRNVDQPRNLAKSVTVE